MDEEHLQGTAVFSFDLKCLNPLQQPYLVDADEMKQSSADQNQNLNAVSPATVFVLIVHVFQWFSVVLGDDLQR